MSIKCYKKMEQFINEFKQELEGILKKQPNNIIFTDNKNNDTIYTLDMAEFEELQVKGIRYKHNQIEVLVDLTSIVYEKEDVYEAKDSEWEPLFGGNILGWFAAVYIAESIDQYVNVEE